MPFSYCDDTVPVVSKSVLGLLLDRQTHVSVQTLAK